MNSDYDRCRALYRAACMQERASHADRQAVRVGLTAAISAGVHAAAVGTSVAAPTVAGVSTVGSKGILGLVLGGKFISGLLVGAALGTAGFVTSVAVQPHEPVRLVQPTRQSMPSRTDSKSQMLPVEHLDAVKSASDAVDSESASEADPVHPVVATTSNRQHHSVTSVSLQPRYSLAEETAALAQVRDALNGKDAELALRLLDQQDRSFSVGQLAEERAAAKVLALCSAGRIGEADAAGAAFIASHPSSPLTKRVRLGCGGQ